ncbi:MAG: hypothetical protein GEU87_08165 [Alphaproteobacteria bacterium]|nr:hypothetical protein [Alphaproteobacteria bacterium]
MKWNVVRISIVAVTGLPLMAFGCQQIDAQNSISLKPGDDVQAAVASAPEGAEFHFAPGIYRMQMIKPKNGQKFIGKPGVVLSGAKILDNWKPLGATWAVSGLPEPLHRSGECDEGFDLCSYREDLFVDGKLYQRVASLSRLSPGKWLAEDDKVYLRTKPAGRKVEIGLAPYAFAGNAENVTIRNLVIEKYATEAQHGAIDGSEGKGWQVIDVVARWNHGGGLYPGKNMVVRGGSYSYNGQIGMVGEGDGAVIDGVEIAHNNWANYNWGWEAGGTKFWRSDGLVVRNSCIHSNNGPGLWTDIDNINILIENNTVFGNDGDGIKHEISYKATIRKNFVTNNGKGKDEWMWGSQILVQNSSDVEVYENTVEVPAKFGNGIGLINQERGDGAHGPWVTTKTNVHDNLIVYLGNRGVTGLVTDVRIEQFNNDHSNFFNRNTYVVTREDQAFWKDMDGDATWSNLRDSHMEKDGKLIVERRSPTKVKCGSK